MPDFNELVKNLYTSKNRELTEDKLNYIENTYKGKEEDFVKNFYATIGEELPEEKFNYIRDTYLKKKDLQGFSQELPKPTMPSGEEFTQGIGLGVKPISSTVSPSVSKQPKSIIPSEFTVEKPVSTATADNRDLALTVESRGQRKDYLGKVSEGVLDIINKNPDIYMSQKDMPTMYGQKVIPAGTPKVENISKAVDLYAEKIKKETGKELSTFDKQSVVQSALESLGNKKTAVEAPAMRDLKLLAKNKLPITALTGIKDEKGAIVKEGMFEENIKNIVGEEQKRLEQIAKTPNKEISAEFKPEIDGLRVEVDNAANVLKKESQDFFTSKYEQAQQQIYNQYNDLVQSGQMSADIANAQMKKELEAVGTQLESDTNILYAPKFEQLNKDVKAKNQEIQTRYNRRVKAQFDLEKERASKRIESEVSKYKDALPKGYLEEAQSLYQESLEYAMKMDGIKKINEFSNLGNFEKMQTAIMAGWGDVASTIGGSLSYVGVNTGNLQNWVAQSGLYNELPVFNDDNVFDNLTNIDWWIANGVRSIPFSIATMPVGIVGGAGAGMLAKALGAGKRAQIISSVVGGGLVGWDVETFLESGGGFNDAIREGKSVSEAAEIAAAIGKYNYSTLPMNMLQMLPVFGKSFKFLGSAGIEAGAGAFEEINQGWAQAKAVAQSEGKDVSYLDYATSPQAVQEGAIGSAMSQGYTLFSLKNTPEIDKQINTLMTSIGMGGESQALEVLKAMKNNGAINDKEFEEANNLLNYTLTAISQTQNINVDDNIKSALVNRFVAIEKAKELLTENENDLASQAAKELIAEKETEIKNILKGSEPVYLVKIVGNDIPVVSTKEEVESILKNEKALPLFEIEVYNDNKTKASVSEVYSKQNKDAIQPTLEVVGEAEKAEMPEDIANLKDDEIIAISVNNINDVPEAYRDRVKEGELKGTAQKSFLGLFGYGKKVDVSKKTYSYTITGKEAKEEWLNQNAIAQEGGKTENEIKVEELRAQEQAEKDATDPNDQEKLDEIYNRYDKLITPLLEGVESEVKTQETISEAADSKGVYLKDGEYGVLRTDGQTVVFETNDKIFDLGNKDELSNASIADFGIEKEEPLNVQVNPDNSIVIDDVRFVNNFSEPQAAINTDADGNVVSVNLETEDGKKRTIRGQRAEEIAYQYKLKEFEQNATEESIARLEQEVTKLEGAAQEIKSQTKKRSAAKRKPKEVAQEQAATEIQVAPLPVEEEVKEREVSEAEVDSVAKNAGVTPKNIRDLYNIGRDLFALNRVQALAQAVVMDKMIGAMAKRKGVKKSEIYKTIQFKKASEKDLPQEALKQTKEEILRVFHGTSKDKDFKKFKDTGKGIFVTISPKDASEYAEQNDSMKFGDYDPVTGKFKEINTASRVIPMNLKLGNVYKLSKEDLAFLNSKPNYSALQKQLHAQIKAQGFDTIDYGNGVYAVITEGRLNSMLTNEVLFQKDLPQGVKMQVDAWHGSPYEFDKFTTEKIGTGEGAQAFGWGLYFTDLESIARNYAEKLSKPNFNKFREKLLKDNPSRDVINDILDFSESYDYNYNKVLDALTKNENKAAVDYLKENKDLFNSVERNLYKVSIQKGKDQSEYTWLEWDKPLGEKQKQLISKAIQDNYLDFTSSERENLSNLDGWDSASGLYMALDNILGSDKEASLFLLKAGINGIKYPAESISRGVTSDTARGFNYVVFDENAVSIEEVIKFQKDAVKARGAMMMNMDGQAVIYALSDPNVSTPLHELAHVFEHYLTESEKNEIIKAAGTKGWTIETSEYFARGFEKYLADGKAPSKGLQKLFDKFKEWLTEIYNGITDSNIDVELNEKMEGIYSQMLGVAAKKEKKTSPQNVLDIAKEAGLSPRQVENTYNKYDGTKNIEDITLEDYNKARAEGNKVKLENSKKAFEALLKEEATKDKVSPTAQKELSKTKEGLDDKALKSASKIMENISEVREKLLKAGFIQSIDCKWG
jgi:hypothetical protein